MADTRKAVSMGLENTFWIGTNFWSRRSGPLMWHDYDGAFVRKELEQLLEIGCNVTRSFLYWPHFVPEEHMLDLDVIDRFSDFLDAHSEIGMSTIPTFIVGHMSGENWDPSWRSGRDLYSDVTMVAEQAWFAYTIAKLFKDHPSVSGWLLSNEMPLYGGRQASEKEVYAWAQSMVHAVRAAGAKQPLSLGDGAWGVEMTGADNGFSLRTLKDLMDFIGPHVYPMQNDEIRELLYASYVCHMAAGFGLPVIMEEFGVTSDFASEENAAIYYKHVLYSTLLAGAKGWIAWNNCDYDALAEQNPYRHHPFELHFGIIDSKGRLKQQAREISSFADFIKDFGNNLSVPKAEIGVVVPEHFETIFPFTEQSFRSDTGKHLFQSYLSSKLADLNIVMVREKDGLGDDCKLYFLPSTKILTTTGLQDLLTHLRNGAYIYLSYFGGSTNNQRGPWLTWLDQLFGVKHKLRYGLVEPIERNEIRFEFVEKLGDIAVGQTLTFTHSGSNQNLGHLPIETAGAKVIAIDQNQMPAITSYENGDGKSFLCTYPLEHFAANLANANPNDISKIYRAVAKEANVLPDVSVDDYRISIGTVRILGKTIIVAANLTSDEIHISLAYNKNRTLLLLSGESVSEKVVFSPYQIHIFVMS